MGVIAFSVCAPRVAWGQTNRTWLPVVNSTWATTGNWSGSNIPDTTGERAIFGSTGVTVTMPNANTTVGGITFNSGAGAYTISKIGGTVRNLSIGTYGINHSDDSTQTITGTRLRLTLAAASSFNINSTGNLVLSTTGNSIATTATNTLTLGGTGTGTGTITSVISGTGGTVTKNGANSTWVLAGNNSFTGGTTVNAGTLRAQTNATALGTGALTLAGGELELANNTGLGFNRNTTVTGSATITSDRISAGAGVTHTLGTLSIGSQTLTIDRGALATSGTGGITFGTTTTTGNANFAVNANALLTLGALGDGGSADTITKSGTGTLTLGTAAGTITNGTAMNVTAGTLNSNNATALGSLTNVTVSAGATVNLGASQTFGALNGASGATVAMGSNTLTVGSTNNLSGTYGGDITGTGALTKAGTGTLTLTGNTNYSGGTNVNAGTLNLQSASAAGTGTITVNPSGTLQLQNASGNMNVANTLVLAGGIVENVDGDQNQLGASSITLTASSTARSSATGERLILGGSSGTITLGTNTLTVDGSGDTIIYAGVGASGEAGNFISNSTGTVWFNRQGGSNNYTGSTTVNSGTLVLGTDPNSLYNNQTIRGNLTIGNGVTTATVLFPTFYGNNKIIDSSTITINEGSTLNMNNAYDTVGAINLTGGHITLGGTPGVSGGSLTAGGDITVNASSTTSTITGFQFWLSPTVSNRNVIVASGAILDVSAQVTSGALTKDGNGTMILRASNTFTGGVTVSDGVLNIRNDNALGSTSSGVSVASGAALEMQDGITAGPAPDVANWKTLTLNGSGVSNDGALRSLSGDNTWYAPINLATSARINTDSDQLTLTGGSITSGTNATLTVGGEGTTLIESAIGTGSGGLIKDGIGTAIVAGNSTFTGATSVDSGVLNVRHNFGLGSAGGGTTVASGAALELQKDASYNSGNDISIGSEALSLSGTGIGNAGALRNITGNNTYGGLVTVASATSRINADAGSLTLSGGVAVGSNALTVGGAANTTITGQLTGSTTSTLTKDGASTLTVSNSTNTFAGDIAITAGTLATGANSSLNSSNIDVNISSGAELDLVAYASSIGTLSGLGNVEFGGNGQLTLLANTTFGGTFTGTGLLVVGSGVSLTLAADFNAPGVTIVLAGGTLNVNGTNSIFAGLSLTANSTIDFDAVDDSMIQFTSLSVGIYSLAVSGWTDEQDFFRVVNDPGNKATAPLNQTTFAPSGPWVGNDTIWTGDYVDYTYDDEVRPWKPIPEPSTYGAMIMAAGLAGLGYRRWRASKQAAAPRT